MIIRGDCLEAMRAMPDGSVSAVVTDPPYATGLFGKDWDRVLPPKEVWIEALRITRPGSALLAFGGGRTYHRLACSVEDAGWQIRPMLGWLRGSGYPKSKGMLKPMWDPILLASNGPVSLNIDGCRLESGRWPGDVLLDEESAAILDAETGVLKSGDGCVRRQPGYFGSGDVRHGGLGGAGDIQTTYGDEGGASRFFYCARASKAEREGNPHPATKPLALMRWLVRLVKTQGAVVLDPFAGSGTTGVACAIEGVEFVGVERESEYADVAERRIAAAQEER